MLYFTIYCMYDLYDTMYSVHQYQKRLETNELIVSLTRYVLISTSVLIKNFSHLFVQK